MSPKPSSETSKPPSFRVLISCFPLSGSGDSAQAVAPVSSCAAAKAAPTARTFRLLGIAETRSPDFVLIALLLFILKLLLYRPLWLPTSVRGERHLHASRPDR